MVFKEFFSERGAKRFGSYPFFIENKNITVYFFPKAFKYLFFVLFHLNIHARIIFFTVCMYKQL